MESGVELVQLGGVEDQVRVAKELRGGVDLGPKQGGALRVHPLQVVQAAYIKQISWVFFTATTPTTNSSLCRDSTITSVVLLMSHQQYYTTVECRHNDVLAQQKKKTSLKRDLTSYGEKLNLDLSCRHISALYVV